MNVTIFYFISSPETGFCFVMIAFLAYLVYDNRYFDGSFIRNDLAVFHDVEILIVSVLDLTPRFAMTIGTDPQRTEIDRKPIQSINRFFNNFFIDCRFTPIINLTMKSTPILKVYILHHSFLKVSSVSSSDR